MVRVRGIGEASSGDGMDVEPADPDEEMKEAGGRSGVNEAAAVGKAAGGRRPNGLTVPLVGMAESYLKANKATREIGRDVEEWEDGKTPKGFGRPVEPLSANVLRGKMVAVVDTGQVRR